VSPSALTQDHQKKKSSGTCEGQESKKRGGTAGGGGVRFRKRTPLRSDYLKASVMIKRRTIGAGGRKGREEKRKVTHGPLVRFKCNRGREFFSTLKERKNEDHALKGKGQSKVFKTWRKIRFSKTSFRGAGDNESHSKTCINQYKGEKGHREGGKTGKCCIQHTWNMFGYKVVYQGLETQGTREHLPRCTRDFFTFENCDEAKMRGTALEKGKTNGGGRGGRIVNTESCSIPS